MRSNNTFLKIPSIIAAFAIISVGHVGSSFSNGPHPNFGPATKYTQDFIYRAPYPPPFPPHADVMERDERFLDQATATIKTRVPPLPTTNNPYALLGFDWLNPPSDFALVHEAYKTMAKMYHPDRRIGPDGTPEERQLANMDFARINSAYEKLKAKQSEEVLDYTVYIDGKKVQRYVTIHSESYYKDPSRPNYKRIMEMARYREKHPKKKMWYDKRHDYDTPRHNGEWAP
ncbi:hypothetical protein ACHAWX_004719 [Stephanocyclus meneghinianus]